LPRNHPLRAALAAAIVLCGVPDLARSQSNAQFIAFQGASKGALYKPDSGPAPHVGIVVMHRTSNYLRHPACTELSRRGFMMLCMTTRFENNEVFVDYEKLPLDVKAGVEFLRRQPGITKVLLFGHSGGGPLMSLYQAVAEKGPSYCKGAKKLTECGDDLAGLPAVDGIIFADPNPGNSVNTLRRIDPSAANENNPPDAPPIADLDMFNPKNGFNPNGASTYSPEFQARYFKAQADRMMRLIGIAQSKLDRIKRNDYPYPDDDIIIIPRSGNPGAGGGGSEASLYVTQPDMPFFNSTAKPARLLRNDGTISTEVIHSVMVANPTAGRAQARFRGGTKIFMLRSFLSAQAIRAKNSKDDIDWCSSNNSTVCAIQSISVPVLFMAMGAHYYVGDGERYTDVASSKDKDFVVIEGAIHANFTGCKPCEKMPGQYSNAQKNLFDYAAKWINDRF
jgi:pimeloyl-ACP methyl ester carboxylesterase